jgi:hypothetical protein
MPVAFGLCPLPSLALRKKPLLTMLPCVVLIFTFTLTVTLLHCYTVTLLLLHLIMNFCLIFIKLQITNYKLQITNYK